MPGVIVDGNDVLAVYDMAGEAIERARRGEGPTLLECKTYRLCGHSRSDPLTYRSKGEETQWRENEPIGRTAEHLKEEDLADDDLLEKVEQDVLEVIDEAISYAESSPTPQPIDTLLHVFCDTEVSNG